MKVMLSLWKIANPAIFNEEFSSLHCFHAVGNVLGVSFRIGAPGQVSTPFVSEQIGAGKIFTEFGHFFEAVPNRARVVDIYFYNGVRDVDEFLEIVSAGVLAAE